MNDVNTRSPPLDEMYEVIESVLTTAIGNAPRRAAARGPGEETAEFLTGCVTIAGPMTGAILLSASEASVSQLASRMLGVGVEELNEEMLGDAFGELTNMVGGNLKALFSKLVGATCQLSVPLVANGDIGVPGGTLIADLALDCPERVDVRIFEVRASHSPVAGQ